LAILCATFFLASAGASAAYLTVSEIFPMETRALAIAFFYAIGTAAGGITGPLLFGHLINTGDAGNVAIGFYIGAGVMAIGGIAELLFGVRAERRSLEGIAEPLAAENVTLDEEVEPDRAGATRDGAVREPAAQPAHAEPPRPSRPATPTRRFRLGPGTSSSSPGMWPSGWVDSSPYDEEVGILQRALEEHGAMERRELARRVGARYWGPGRFHGALEQAVRDGSVSRLSRSHFGPAGEGRRRDEEMATAGRS
jgi:hypothetical protein